MSFVSPESLSSESQVGKIVELDAETKTTLIAFIQDQKDRIHDLVAYANTQPKSKDEITEVWVSRLVFEVIIIQIMTKMNCPWTRMEVTALAAQEGMSFETILETTETYVRSR